MNCRSIVVETIANCKMLKIAFQLIALILCSATMAMSQCSTWIEYYEPYGPYAPPGSYNCSAQGPWQGSCTVNTNKCAPPAAPQETQCIECQRARAGAPINLSSGDTFVNETDIRIPGLGGGLVFNRTWNSMWPATQAGAVNGLFGPQWRSTFEERVFIGSDN